MKKIEFDKKKSMEALEAAKKKNVLARALEIQVSEDVYEEIRKVIAGE